MALSSDVIVGFVFLGIMLGVLLPIMLESQSTIETEVAGFSMGAYFSGLTAAGLIVLALVFMLFPHDAAKENQLGMFRG